MRLYFFVKVRKARGLSVAGGNIIGRTVGALKFGGGMGSVFLDGSITAGVPNAGEDDGIMGSVAS